MAININQLETDAAYWDECKAPKWAKSFGFAGPVEMPVWYNMESYQHALGSQKYNNFKFATKGTYNLCDVRFIVSRPKIKDDEWVDGLPPVGVECELNLYGHWIVATVLAYGKTKFLYEISPGQVDSDGDPIGGELDGFVKRAKFRPIRTKAHRDRDDLQSLLEEYLDWGHSKAMSNKVVDAIIAAGWTKP